MESETELAYSGLHQLCAPLLDGHLDRLPVPQRDALATALGMASAGAPPDRFLVGLATLSLVADAAEQQPLACFVDDGQWLDRASGQVLSFVARRLLAEPVALICATRTGQDDDVLAGLPELAVHGLTDRDARALLLSSIHGPMDSAIVDQIVTESHGNPLALLELPRTWLESDLAGGYGLPDTPTTTHKIERSYVRRLELLPTETQLIALTAAAEPLGDPVLLSQAAEPPRRRPGHGAPGSRRRAARGRRPRQLRPSSRSFRHLPPGHQRQPSPRAQRPGRSHGCGG